MTGSRAVIHARGLGQVSPICQGGKQAPLGWASPLAEVTCLACIFQPYMNTARILGGAFSEIGRGVSEGFVALAELLGLKR